VNAVSFENVVVESETGARVLDGISFQLEEGESLALVGHNGGGKTTALRLAAGLSTPTSGKVRVLGQNVAKLGYDARRQHHLRVGFVFESGGLWANRTVRENIALPLAYHGHESPAEAALALAQELGIAAHLDSPSFRVNSSVRKRTLFARALGLSPRVLLCDEPQVGLVMKEARRVAEAITRRKRDGMSILYADHDGDLAPFTADHRVYFENGVLLLRPSAIPPSDRDNLRLSIFGASLLGGHP
jgi:ABC-type lipoprotein export system ATPase subunit